MKKDRSLELRNSLVSALAVSPTEAQWRHLEGLETYGALITGTGSFNAWLTDSAQMLADFGIATTSSPSPDPISTEIRWKADEDADRRHIDHTRSALVAQLAREEFADFYYRCRSWTKELRVEQVLAEFDQLSYQELSTSQAVVSPEVARLRDLLGILRQHPGEQSLVDVQGLKAQLEGHAAGVIAILLPEGGGLYRIPYFAQDGLLAQVQAKFREIADKYTWVDYQAAGLFLFDVTPQIASSLVVWHPHNALPGLSRLWFGFDPSLSPDEVREIYREERRKYCKYSMRISHKHLFAAFAAFTAHSSTPWPERYKFHSETCRSMPEGEGMEFANAKTFRRDAEKAFNKLLFPKFGVDNPTD